MHRHFFKKLSQNSEYIQTRCNDRNNAFHFACHKWYLCKEVKIHFFKYELKHNYWYTCTNIFNFWKIVSDTMFKISWYSDFLMGY